MLKGKLEEAQKSLEGNAQMIMYLNKQLNDKPGSSLLTGTSAYNASKYGVGSKPPTSVIGGGNSTFKPSFTTMD